ncbi:MauE/DoxX family redox-associated membrane protein [Cerasicoccus maritimus]|uniref:MauE/DoxX family redox-associated membrane protein n=1 Tax=Cerasicoccus maritimus TaxID=490089 RepID=UPI002852BF41|nr:MauE/DoxX family redox-associated membrane protein [Cerasicoccus maritimus]
MKLIAHILAVALGGFFIYAGVGKIAAPVDFFESILNYQLVGAELAWLVAMFLPWLEVLAGAALIWPKLRCGGLLWIGGMLLVFIVALITALVRGLDIECGCTGTGGSSVTYTLIQDIFLLAAIVAICLLDRKPQTHTA